MLPTFFLLLFLCESTVTSFSTMEPSPSSPIYEEYSISTTTMEGELSSLQLVATPDYPVAAGQRVDLNCSAFNIPQSVIWYWEHLDNQTWQIVHRSRDLTLTKPEESGKYRCSARSPRSLTVSPNHTVYIVSIHGTVGENLGIAAFFLSLLALVINLVILFWLGCQRFGDTLIISNTVAKGFPGPEKSPKGGLPQTEGDGDVYMNYTSTDQSYTDLNPTNMTEDNVYSSLS